MVIGTQLALVAEERNGKTLSPATRRPVIASTITAPLFLDVELVTQLFLAQEAAENLVKEKAAAQYAQQKAVDELQRKLT